MPLFFIVSGVLAAKSKTIDNVIFLRNKFFGLVYVWFIWRWLEWIFMRFEFSGLLPLYSYVPQSFSGNWQHLVSSPFQPLWFLIDLFLFFSILWVTRRISFKNNKIWCFLFVFSIILLVLFSRSFLYKYIPNARYFLVSLFSLHSVFF